MPDLQHLTTLSEKDRHLLHMTILAMTILYVLAITFIKLSILFFYRRTFTMYDQWLRWCWWLLLVFVLLWTLICFVLLALQESGITSIGAFERLAVSTTGIVR